MIQVLRLQTLQARKEQQVQPEMGSHRQQKIATEHSRSTMMMGLHLQHQI